MPKELAQANSKNNQSLFSKLRSFLPELPTTLPVLPSLPTLTMPKALSKFTSTELPTFESLPELLPGFVAKKLGVNNHNALISTLAGYHKDLVKFANIIFGSAALYCSNKTDTLVGTFAAQVYPLTEAKADKTARDALNEFMKTQAAALNVFKAELKEAIVNPKSDEFSKEEASSASYDQADDEAGSDIDEHSDIDAQSNDGAQYEANFSEASEILVEEKQKKLCAALVHSIAGLSTLYHQAKNFHQLCANYRQDPATTRAALDTAYHLCRETIDELTLLLPAVYQDYDYDDVPDLNQITADLPNTLDSLVRNAPHGYAPSIQERVRVAPRR